MSYDVVSSWRLTFIILIDRYHSQMLDIVDDLEKESDIWQATDCDASDDRQMTSHTECIKNTWQFLKLTFDTKNVFLMRKNSSIQKKIAP